METLIWIDIRQAGERGHRGARVAFASRANLPVIKGEKTPEATIIPSMNSRLPSLSSWRRYSNLLPLAVFSVPLLLYLLPLFVLQQEAYLRIPDNLDSDLVHRLVLSRSGTALSFDPAARVESFMGGLPRACLPSGWNVLVWLFLLFEPFTAYLLNELFIRVIAFGGMYRLLRRPLLARQGVDPWLAAGVALCFAILPFFPTHGLSIAGQPLVLAAFLRLRRGPDRLCDYLCLALFPFYSSLILAGVFVLVLLTALFLRDLMRQRRPNLRFARGLVLLAIVYAGVEWQMLQQFLFDPQFVSHRVEFNLTLWSQSWEQVKQNIVANLLAGHLHAATVSRLILLAILPLALLASALRRTLPKLLLQLAAAIAALAVFAGLYQWQGLLPLREELALLRSFQFDRFYVLQPMLWYLLLAVCLAQISPAIKPAPALGRMLAYVLLLAQANAIWPESLTQDRFYSRHPKFAAYTPNYREFYSEELFQEIAQFIGRPQSAYRVICVGFHPAVAQFNGFYTLDGYAYNYPLEYKHRFRRLIAGELDKAPALEAYFDGWGNRCYALVAEAEGRKVNDLQFDLAALREMGGEFILSDLEIGNAQALGLELQRVFEHQDSPWRIHLYRVAGSRAGAMSPQNLCLPFR